MRSASFSPLAVQDLVEIRDYIARDNPAAADKLISRIEAAVAKLAEWPGIGHRRRDVGDHRYLFFTVRPYVLAYEHDDSAMALVRVLHGARDIRKIIKPT
jgi:plasmid stabilization system protein ParE